MITRINICARWGTRNTARATPRSLRRRRAAYWIRATTPNDYANWRPLRAICMTLATRFTAKATPRAAASSPCVCYRVWACRWTSAPSLPTPLGIMKKNAVMRQPPSRPRLTLPTNPMSIAAGFRQNHSTISTYTIASITPPPAARSSWTRRAR